MKWIDFRSDTVTEPTEEMLDAMRNAEVGDDVYEEDPTVNKLQKESAILMGKEAALFVPTGTFANQLSILTHTSMGDEIIVSKDNHIFLYEVGASAVISSVQLQLLGAGNGKVDIDELESSYRSSDIHFPRTGLVCIENAHSSGTVMALDNMREVFESTRAAKIPVHLDGARIFNASVFLNIDPARLAAYADSVMFCLSKGLCSPAGSILAGSGSFVRKARKYRKMMGGGMRQAGYLAAPGLISIDKMALRLEEDHSNAKYLASRLEETGLFSVNKDKLDINMVFCGISQKSFDEDDFIDYLKKNNIKIHPIHDNEYRFVTHYWITKENIDYFVEVIKKFK